MKNLPFGSAVFAALLTAACSAPPRAALSIEDDAESYASVVVCDDSLYPILRTGKPVVSRAADNCLQVTVPVRNIDDEQIQILAQFEFRDRNQQPIGDVTNRQVQIVPPGGTVNLTSTSRTDAAQDYVVRLFWNK